ncbi:MAG TPA: heme ABC exporter ATP-binding protein CcmA [Gemmatimonadaceae bacterium]|nr:heme ABC exporter ATP-binding protein CcmA [Gemmatimonadaceae bacterium]
MHTGHPELAMHLSGLGKRFASRWVLRGVTLEVQPGEAVGLLGANGSGKSTVLRILGTLLSPTVGTAAIDGLDIVREAGALRGRVGYLAHTPGLYDDLTARENLRFAADMLGLGYGAVDESLERVGLAGVAGDRVRGFSAGMQRRLGIARMILRAPRILLLDEPYSNLDADGIDLMNSILGDVIRSGGAALVALHELAPARDMLARNVTLVDGRIESEPGRAGRDRTGPISVMR